MENTRASWLGANVIMRDDSIAYNGFKVWSKGDTGHVIAEHKNSCDWGEARKNSASFVRIKFDRPIHVDNNRKQVFEANAFDFEFESYYQ